MSNDGLRRGSCRDGLRYPDLLSALAVQAVPASALLALGSGGVPGSVFKGLRVPPALRHCTPRGSALNLVLKVVLFPSLS